MLDNIGRYILHDFQQQRPFSSLLPGIAGPLGIPMWAFYVNRGQAISSFGVQDKDHAFMEFQPANKAYQMTALTGFRTFIKLASSDIYEPFSPWQAAPSTRRDLMTGMNEVEIQEINSQRALQVNVIYFTLPGEPFAALVRQVSILNLGGAPVDFDLLDGMPAAIPYGVDNRNLKEIHRTIEAWMQVFNRDQSMPFYRVGSSVGDSAEVAAVEKGFFALALEEERPLAPIVDPALVFGQDTSLYSPEGFKSAPLAELLQRPQVTRGKTPCAFFGARVSLAPGQQLTFTSVYGMANQMSALEMIRERLARPGYMEEKIHQARSLVTDLTDNIACQTSSSLFDSYCRQTFLDNVLRGGWPVLLGSGTNPAVFHLYSRKHGDLERDYNAFFLAAEHFSQGNGNFRDVVQNRRSDVFFNPRLGDFNIRVFTSLIQPDGYNPLVVKGSRFLLAAEDQAALLAEAGYPQALKDVISRAFTPGELLEAAARPQTGLRTPPEKLLDLALSRARQQTEADFGEGYWTDHWFYLLDLIENFLAVYPERKAGLLFGAANIPYYDSTHMVKPRSRKYVRAEGKIRQYEALELDKQKAALIENRTAQPNWVHSAGGRGEVCQTTLFEKLAGLALLKFATLDPYSMGIEMEAGKPGWCDALNGLPGLFGSSLCETLELQRLLTFLIDALAESQGGQVFLYDETAELLRQVSSALEKWRVDAPETRDFTYWDAIATLREKYREKIWLGFNGLKSGILADELAEAFKSFQAKLAWGVERAVKLNHGVLPTYLTFSVTSYEKVLGSDGSPQLDEQGRTYVRALGFEPHPLPAFLEGFVHALKIQPNPEAARHLYDAVRASQLYDRPLQMYRTNASLEEESHEIGRIRAFPPGWLENEAVFLHMEYKYLLELLKAGLLDEFFADLRSALIPFQDPARYGRSPLENSSFLVSSVYADPSLHGGGFVARLTGATAEFIQMWTIMMAGKQPFQIRDGELVLALRPSLPGWLFPEDGLLSFRFLGSCMVRLHNPARLDTYAGKLRPFKTVLVEQSGSQVEFPGEVIPAPYAAQVRSGSVKAIDIYYHESETKEFYR